MPAVLVQCIQYFVPLGEQQGQTAALQVDTMQDLHSAGWKLVDNAKWLPFTYGRYLKVLKKKYRVGLNTRWTLFNWYIRMLK